NPPHNGRIMAAQGTDNAPIGAGKNGRIPRKPVGDGGQFAPSWRMPATDFPLRRPCRRLLPAVLLSLFTALPAMAESADDSGFAAAKTEAIEAAIAESVRRQEIPGAVVWIERDGKHWGRAVGYRAVDPAKVPVQPDTIYDAASLS